jgi:glycosyltransferase involved in cell wall biosynthesis
MKIVLATPIYPPEIGGPATYTKELSERFHSKHDLTIVAYTDSREIFPGTRLEAISKRRPLPVRLFKYFLTLWRVSGDADVIYVQNAMASGLPTALVSMVRRKPFVLKFVGDEAWERATQNKKTTMRLEEFLDAPDGGFKIKLMMFIQGWVLRRASMVTTPSEYLGKAIQQAYKIKEGRVITNYNAAEETEITPFEPKPTRHQITTTARLTSWKGVNGIIRAVAEIKKKYPDIKFVCAGDGPEMDNLKELVRELGVQSQVTLLGKISRAETWQLRKNSELYVLNSTYEGLPHTVLTSFAAKIPTIATNVPGTNEAVYHENTGLLVPPESPVELARAIERLFEDKELSNRLVANASRLLESKFSWSAHIRNLEEILVSTLKPGN